MKTRAVSMVLLMIASALAGCTSGDPDGDGEMGIDTDMLNDLIEDNLQDFINNTSVTVHQEIHYHNNTTNNIDDSDNSVSNYNGTGSLTDSTMYMFTISWDREEAILPFDPYNDLISLFDVMGGNHSEMPDQNDPTLLFERSYNGQMVEIRLSCMEYLSFSRFNSETWRAWLEDNYGYGPSGEATNVGYDLDNWYNGNYNDDIDNYCSVNDWTDTNREILFEIELEQGQAMSMQVIPSNVDVDLNCEDGYGTGVGNGTATTYLGGQSDCTITGSTKGYWEIRTNGWVYDEDGNRLDAYNTNTYYYDWYVDYWLVAPSNFAVYFTMHDVEVYELE